MSKTYDRSTPRQSVSETTAELRKAPPFEPTRQASPFEPESAPSLHVAGFGKFKGRDLADIASELGGIGWLGWAWFNVPEKAHPHDIPQIGRFLNRFWAQDGVAR